MSELLRLLTKLRGGRGEVMEEDVVRTRSTKALKQLGAGYEAVEVRGTKMVRSVVKELDDDGVLIPAQAQEEDVGGRVTEDMLVTRKGWGYARARAVLENMLLRDGLCGGDERGRSYWILSAITWEE